MGTEKQAEGPTPGAGGVPVWLDDAMAVANVPTLACLLVQLTGDMRWLRAPYIPARTRGLDDNDDGGLPSERQAEIRTAARAAIAGWFGGRPPAMSDPDDAQLCAMISTSLGDEIPLGYAPMIRHELRLPASGAPAAAAFAVPEGFLALIIGAGISGLCAAMAFEKAGIPYVIVERSQTVGGVWHESRYPGAACDVPSHLYSFTEAPYDWSRYFAGSREIHDYLRAVAAERDIMRHIRFGLEVKEARYLEDAGMWEADVVSADGRTERMRANIVLSCVGVFNKPSLPKIPGMGSFRGPSVHTARYPEEGLDLRGRRVALVGNGASAMQVAPAIADEVAALTIIQRTPQWVAPFPKFGESIPPALRSLLQHMPLYRRWYRLRLSWAFNDKLYEALQRDPAWSENRLAINAINDSHRRGLTAYIKSELGEAQHLLPQVLPGYPPFGKRMLLDNGWYRALARPHVRLISGSVSRVEPDRLVTSDGEGIDADVIIWATGYDVLNLLVPMRVTGVGGLSLHDEWEGDNARAYLGTVVPGFPNLFCLYGPNTQFGHGGSLISVLERQMHYVMSLLGQMFDKGVATIDARRDVYEDYNARVDEAHARMIWTLPTVSGYYRNARGRIVVNNPFRILDVWNMTETANLGDYRCLPGAPA